MMSTDEPVTFLSLEEAKEGMAERKSALPRSAHDRNRIYNSQEYSTGFSLMSIPRFFRDLWSNSFTLNARLVLSRFFRSVGHSRHLRHGLKNAAGVALLGFPAFLPRDSTGMFSSLDILCINSTHHHQA